MFWLYKAIIRGLHVKEGTVQKTPISNSDIYITFKSF
jgi:hypothetical protein